MLEPTQLIAPEGEIEPAMFPGDSPTALADRVQAYITAGTDKATADGVAAGDLDAAARAWAYYRAFRAVFVRLSASPSSVSLANQGGSSRTTSQISEFAALAEGWRTDYLALVPEAPPPRTVPQSAPVKNRFTW